MHSSSFSRDESNNEFISSQENNTLKAQIERQKAEEYQKMFMMFQKMATDPALFMKMMSSVNTADPEQEQRRREFQVEQHKYRNHEVSPKRRDSQSPLAAKQSRKRGTDVLGRSRTLENDNVLEKYYNGPNEKGTNLAESNITISTKQQHVAQNEDRPIQSAYAQNNKLQQYSKPTPVYQQPSLNNYTPDDDRPIKPAKGYNYEMNPNQSGIINNNSSVVNPSKYWEAEERPIKGIQGDFKAFVMKEQGFPMAQNMEENIQEQENSQVPKARSFLKRGSRQYLSSAKDKSVAKPKPNAKGNTRQQLDFSQAIMKNEEDKPQRSISQNRVLGRKSISSKSITKKPAPKPKAQQQKKTLQYSNTTSNYNSTANAQGNRTPRIAQKNQVKNRENSSSPTFQTESEVKTSKPAKKNIFQESSSEQEDSKHHNNGLSVTGNKSEVIPGVFLTKKELHQILTKYGKNAPPVSASYENDIREMKAKYVELTNIQVEQNQQFQIQMKKQREQFEQYKLAEITKIKNERKVQERNMMNSQKNKQREKQREQYENLKKTLEKERQQFRHKQKNYKLLIEKLKKSQIRQKSASTQQYKQPNFQSGKSEQGLASKKKAKNYAQPTYTEGDETVTNSYKGVEENNGYNINKRANQNKDSFSAKDNKDKLPNYQDLKKSTSPANVNPNSNKLSASSVQQNNDRNKKYQYYEELENKETVKDKGKQYNLYRPNEEEAEENPSRSQDEDRQQIVEYNPSMKLSDLTKIPLNIKMVTDKMINNLFRSENNPEYRKYLELTKKPRNKIHTSRSAAEHKTTNVYADGGKQIIFDTGVRKQYFNNGYVIIFFSNGDIKQKLPDETVLYFYKQKEVDQITLPDKTNIYRFDNNQVEFHFADETVQVRHPDGTFKVV